LSAAISGFTAALFHLLNHAIFKCLLFFGAGAISGEETRIELLVLRVQHHRDAVLEPSLHQGVSARSLEQGAAHREPLRADLGLVSLHVDEGENGGHVGGGRVHACGDGFGEGHLRGVERLLWRHRQRSGLDGGEGDDVFQVGQVFGAPLMQMQNTRFKLAECETQTEVARAFVDDCIARLQAGTLDVPTAAMAKWWVSDACCRVVDECLQLFGGYGYMNEYPIARLYADVRVSRIYGGANEVMKEVIARSLEKR